MSNEDVDEIRARADRLQALCGDIYVAAVELGLPRDLLNRLWAEIGHGQRPEAYRYDGFGDVEPRPAAAPHAEPPPAPLAPLKERRTVMIVDDDPMMLDVLLRILRRENYDLVLAKCGLGAVAKSEELPQLDLLITDCVMPDLTGPQVAERIRARFPELPVLYQTGFSDILFDQRVELGANEAFVEKPFSARGLQEAARLLLFGTIAQAAAERDPVPGRAASRAARHPAKD